MLNTQCSSRVFSTHREDGLHNEDANAKNDENHCVQKWWSQKAKNTKTRIKQQVLTALVHECYRSWEARDDSVLDLSLQRISAEGLEDASIVHYSRNCLPEHYNLTSLTRVLLVK